MEPGLPIEAMKRGWALDAVWRAEVGRIGGWGRGEKLGVGAREGGGVGREVGVVVDLFFFRARFSFRDSGVWGGESGMSVLGFDAVLWGEELGDGGFGASMFFGAGSAGISAGMRGSAWARERPALLPIANFWVWCMRDVFH